MEPVSTVQEQAVVAARIEPQSMSLPGRSLLGRRDVAVVAGASSYVTFSVLWVVPDDFWKLAVAMWSPPSSVIVQSVLVDPAQSVSAEPTPQSVVAPAAVRRGAQSRPSAVPEKAM